jgi:hypothetical protein
MVQHLDVIVIESGPAGRRAAVQAAKLEKGTDGFTTSRAKRSAGSRHATRYRQRDVLYSSWRRHHLYGLVCGQPLGESSQSS